MLSAGILIYCLHASLVFFYIFLHFIFFLSSVLYFSWHRYEHQKFWPNLRESDYDSVGKEKGAGFNINVPWNKVHNHRNTLNVQLHTERLYVCNNNDLKYIFRIVSFFLRKRSYHGYFRWE